MNKSPFIALLLSLVTSFSLTAQTTTKITPKREFRGVWVATVTNIDWPSKPGLSVDQQKQELIGILEQHKKNGINAIMLQIRPTADALYAKSRELWSHWLMGKQGLAPTQDYDPLAFAIKEAHLRGMELHAWFNPYRATMSANAVTSSEHITQKRPELFYTYGGQKLFDPGLPEVRDYIMQVILDVVKEYDIDGVHFDDYFYPYRIAGQTIKDSATFAKYPNGFTNIDDWRRNNVDMLIKMVNDSVHYYKKYVKFGVSPFGIWRNYREDTLGSKTNGLSNYGELYADSRKWIKEGWVDYINPQIYFTFSRQAAPFGVLLDWWSNNTYGRHLYIGQAAYLVHGMPSRQEAAWGKLSEIPNQIRYIRANNRVQGSVFFSSKSLSTVARAVADSLRNDLYKYPALPPQMPWLDDVMPNQPQSLTAEAEADGVNLKWAKPLKAKDGETASGYVVYRFEEGEKISILDAKNIVHISFEDFTFYLDTNVEKGKRYNYLVTALDRLKNESEPSGPVGIQAK
ncbi:family 10 glycosylhydrolase [Pedobacter sp. KR3-3]|uniref:Family 10 glycosylhydrolase n=1 Tax=Pedobacter albus TaxID=3113905 RepID=A0ABU7IB52_9SPHI|nr:family 10 glycosylhydrolase [Pedobacter sp. KR3-3]MEE1946707.1 family 10 glycosylhydrolase [Pedobacter sp. KR3-3]